MSFFTIATFIRAVILLAAICGLIQYKKLDKATKLLVWLLLVTFTTEALAVFSAYYFHNNNPVYNISSIIKFTITCLYFESIIPQFKTYKLGRKIALAGFTLSIFNTIFFQSLLEVNSYFLAFESITIVGLCLYYFYDYLSQETFTKKLPIHFWFTSLLLTFWSFTFFYWLIAYALMFSDSATISWLSWILFSFNIIYYGGFTIIFLFYKKLSANE